MLLRLALDQQGARQMDRIIGPQRIPLQQKASVHYQGGAYGEQAVPPGTVDVTRWARTVARSCVSWRSRTLRCSALSTSACVMSAV